MKFLIIDTSCKLSHVHFVSGEDVKTRENLGEKTHSVSLLPMIDQVLGGEDIKNLDFIAVTVGPGSYTGLRIGISTAKLLAFGGGIPLVPINTLDYVAVSNIKGKKDGDIVVPLLDARNNQAFYAVFRIENNKLNIVHNYDAGDVLDIKQTAASFGSSVYYCGDGANNILNEESCLGDGLLAGKFAENLYLSEKDRTRFDPKNIEAFYLKDVHVTLKNNG